MPEEKNKPDQKGGESKTPATSASSANAGAAPRVQSAPSSADGKDFQKNLNDALQAYMRSLQEVNANAMKRAEELYHEFLKAQKEQQVIVDENLKEDYRNFVTSMQQVWGQENAQSKAEDANRSFLLTVSDRQGEQKKNFDELYANYRDTLQKHAEQTQKSYSGIYRELLKSIQAAWSSADIANFDTHTLASAGQILIAVGQCASQTMPAK